jgi:hypothetical protein
MWTTSGIAMIDLVPAEVAENAVDTEVRGSTSLVPSLDVGGRYDRQASSDTESPKRLSTIIPVLLLSDSNPESEA